MEVSMLATMFPRTHIQYRALPLLGPVLEDLGRWLQASGFPLHVIRGRLLKARFLDAWLRARGVMHLEACTASQLRAHLPCGTARGPVVAHALGMSLVQYLTAHNALTVPPATRSSDLLAAYRTYLVQVRGLAPGTLRGYLRVAREFLSFLDYERDPSGLARLQVCQVDAFVTHTGRRLRRISMVLVTSGLRTFLRFLALETKTAVDLAGLVESPRQYHGERLPRALPWSTVLTLIREIDRSTVGGLRDYAVALLIATYGVRAGEVAQLRLDDIHWRARVILVPRPKVGKPLAVPLTDEVAHALLQYLRARHAPPSERHLFLRVHPPAGPIMRSAVLTSMRRRAERGDLPLPVRFGPHCFRHSLAMHLLRQGTPLTTIADLLGHASISSTQSYLRLDVEDLRGVALPLPQAEGR
jgi:site-specific recombinase XerD